ncbi:MULTISPECIES: pantoate--beta-alanine ligase [Methylobacterium]|jgi:pantoate--beta-alanine ligase|uniref:pantoate--beta-alanine ligase n=2 Tax=Methylobacteriaceae TaxID=119045 RepID=UPI0008EA3067|nr:MULTISPECIES: pantoate--beta-alanine ligase [Methylobacterium]MBK3400277.1 pantoate--beta-alanine ligase [Methylobacterium ajmalii]MBK3411867.1 pantoate--beta-alanine ligase [Methylobacterium ajmalii]MBZ6411666.1 pantoate--beta-alanine ligase [Methylobacterium sp.]SFE42655.1 pantoate--beta-alanine ligase [Methylobacterium sp. yr596]
MTPPPSPSAVLRLGDVAALRAQVRAWRNAGETVALVPTMGALHEGHLALVRQAQARCRRVVVSIFVNPTQFGPNEDFSRYPRVLEDDIALLAETGADAAYLPDVATMYPPGFATTVTVEGLTDVLCGPVRPGHFAGVATVVTKLLLQALPDVALFGEKDFQQLQVIRRAARDLDVPVAIEGVPTVREADGLALSSRNRYLSDEERRAAPTIHAVLQRVAAAVRGGAATAPALAEGRAALEAAGFGPVQYLSVNDAESLAPLDRVAGPARVLVAAYLGRTRLIDNVAV